MNVKTSRERVIVRQSLTMRNSIAGDSDQRGRLKLILAAEHLFSVKGMNGVSLREVAVAADNRNNNAVQYHFGSKEGLIQAIMELRITQLDLLRGIHFAGVVKAGQADDIGALLRTYFLPHLELMGEKGGYPYAGFMAEYLTRMRPLGIDHAGDLSPPDSIHRHIAGLLAQRVSHLPHDIFWSRFELCHLMFFNTIVRWEHSPRFDDRTLLRRDVDDILGVMTAALSVPLAD
jgi:AcrR family transcriptional regulator